ncbi:MAG: amidohydrolase family protein [Chloroflexi bacterium]|nr:amidohydrolase family protein [Chloroflexota bacterium]
MILDLNVYLGQWPFRRLRHGGTEGVHRLLARTGASQALAAPLQGIFYKNPAEGVREMLDELGIDHPDLLPLAMVNPAFPGWERDLRQMAEEWGCVACGLAPIYHGYRVYDDGAAALCGALRELGLPAVLFVRLQDERSHPLLMQVPALPTDDMAYLLKAFPDLPIAICNANLPAEATPLAPLLGDRAATLFTTSYKSLQLARMVEVLGAEHLAYGSGLPLYYPESALLQVQRADIGEAARASIIGGNARALLGLGGAPC